MLSLPTKNCLRGATRGLSVLPLTTVRSPSLESLSPQQGRRHLRRRTHAFSPIGPLGFGFPRSRDPPAPLPHPCPPTSRVFWNRNLELGPGHSFSGTVFLAPLEAFVRANPQQHLFRHRSLAVATAAAAATDAAAFEKMASVSRVLRHQRNRAQSEVPFWADSS